MVLPLLSLLAENLSLHKVIIVIAINILLFVATTVLSVFCNSKIEKVIYSILFIISYIPFVVYTGYLLFAKVLLQKNSIISLFETNPDESREFMTHYFNPLIIGGCAAYILVCFLGIWLMSNNKRSKIKDHKPVFWVALITIITILTVPQLSQSVYFVNFYNLFANYKYKLLKERVAIQERQTHPYDVTNTHQDSLPKTIVVVVGESLTREHMSLYGYARNTNPKLAAIGDDLKVYSDVISPQVHTIPVMRSVLTLADKDNPLYITQKPSLFELFNRAGYETYVITNQSYGGKIKTSYDALLELSENIYNLSAKKRQDEIVLPVLNDILARNSKKDRLIFIHLMGNHMAYEYRYTPQYNIFSNNEDQKIEITDFRDRHDINVIDKYDNSVAYNDFIIASIIESLKQENEQETALIYFSDHGEEVFDNRKFSGHAYEKVSSYMCHIPFMLWLSPQFSKNCTNLTFDTSLPYSTVDFLYSLSDLAGLDYEDYDSTKSIFSKNFRPSPRYVGDYTYDKVVTKTLR